MTEQEINKLIKFYSGEIIITNKRTREEVNNLSKFKGQQFFDLPPDCKLSTIKLEYCFISSMYEKYPITEIYTNAKVLYINYIDRGVQDWTVFGDWFTTKFPNVNILIMAQDFSYSGEEEGREPVEPFLNFIKRTNLKLFVFKDFQTREYRGEAFYKKWINCIPENSIHVFLTDCCHDLQSGETHEFCGKENSKLLVRGRT